jgi:hypothetical protein
MTNYATLQEEDTIASHAFLAFLARGLATDLKHIIVYYTFSSLTIVVQSFVSNVKSTK